MTGRNRGGGGRRGGNVPVMGRFSKDVRVFYAKVLSVNRVNWTVTIQEDAGGMPIEDIPVMPTCINKDGGGSFWLPETNSIVIVCKASNKKYFIMGGAALASQLDEGDEDEEPGSCRMNRAVPNEGDIMVAQQDGAFIVLRKGGVIEIGASQAAQRKYIPLSNLIREFFQNYEASGTWGSLKVETRVDDESYGTTEVDGEQVPKTATELKLSIKEYSQEDPIIEMGLGRISTSDQRVLPGGKNLTVVGRININNNVLLWVDKDGNLLQHFKGGTQRCSTEGSRVDTVRGSWSEKVVGMMREEFGGRKTKVFVSDSLSVGRDRTVTIGGNLTETISGSVFRTQGRTTEDIGGDRAITVKGSQKTDVTANAEDNCAGDRTVTSANSKEVVSGRKVLSIANASFTDGELTGLDISTVLGDIQIVATAGKVRITAGGTDLLPMAQMVMKISGTVKFTCNTAKTIGIEANNSGIQLKTTAGEITVDNAGIVNLGPILTSATGGVVTTMTHPTDYITGLPILGSDVVSAGSVGPGRPTGVPAPSSFLPDPS